MTKSLFEKIYSKEIKNHTQLKQESMKNREQ